MPSRLTPTKDLLAAQQLLYKRNPNRPNTPIDPNKAPKRQSNSPRSRRLKPRQRPASAVVAPRNYGEDTLEESIMLGSGLYMNKSQSKITVTLRTEQIGEERPKSKTPEQNLRAVIKELEHRISELEIENEHLSIALEEEKVSHKVTKRSAAEELNFQLQEMKESHLDVIQNLKRETSYQLDEQKRKYEYHCEKMEKQFQNSLDQKSYQLELVEKAFETYKANIAAEVDAKIHSIELNLKEEAEKDKIAALNEQKRVLNAERDAAISGLNEKHMQDMKIMIHEKDREKQELIRSFSEATQDLAKFQSAIEDLATLRGELENSQIETRALKKEISNRENDLAEARLKISDFERNFQRKVDQVEEKFWVRAESMLEENVDLKRRLNQKSTQLFTVMAENSSSSRDKAYSAVKTMTALVEARIKAGVPVVVSNVSSDVEKKSYTRRLSAPITNREYNEAFSCAGVHESDEDDVIQGILDTSGQYEEVSRVFEKVTRPKSSIAKLT